MRKFKRAIPLILSALLLPSCSQSANSSRGYKQITMDEAAVMMEKEKDYTILDVRAPEEFTEGHIPGAINIPNENIGTEEIPELPDKKDSL